MNRFFAVAAALMIGTLGSVSAAHAQANGGWTLNIDNTGYNPIEAGGLLPYSIAISANSHEPTGPTTITFNIPAKAEFLGVDGLDNCEPTPDVGQPVTVTCDVPALVPYPNGLIDAVVNLRPLEEGTVNLIAEMAGDGPNFSRRTTVERGADLELAIVLEQTELQAGSVAGFSASVTNNGPYRSEGGRFVMPLPQGFSRDIMLPGGCDLIGDDVICDIAGLDAGQSVVLDFGAQVIVQNASTISLSGTVTSNSPRDPVQNNNNATASLTVTEGIDVSLGKTRAPQGLILVGDELTFTLEPRFAGRAPTQAGISDSVPTNYEVLAVIPAAGSGWSCPWTGGQEVDCTYAGTGAGFTDAITIEVRAISATDLDDGVTNRASIETPNENADMLDNNEANDGNAIIAEPYIDLRAHKSGPERGLVTVGNSYDFTLYADNKGNAGFYGPLTITDHLPAGLELTNLDVPAGWICAPLTGAGAIDIVCETDIYTEAAPLAPDAETARIVLTTEVTGTGSISNGMTVSFPDYDQPGGDKVPGNNHVTSGVTSADDENWADVAVIKKRVAPGAGIPINSGDAVTFEIEIVNSGPAPAQKVRLDDRLNDIVGSQTEGKPLPSDVVVSQTDGTAQDLICKVEGSSAYSLDLQCDIETLPMCEPGDDCPVITVTVKAGSEGVKTNTAVAFSSVTPDNDTDNNTDSVDYTVVALTDVTVVKTSPASEVGAQAGQELIYTLAASVLKNGLSAAENVTVTDTLPHGLLFKSAVPSIGDSCEETPTPNTLTGPGNDLLICNLGTIGNGSQQTVDVYVVPQTALVGTQIINEVEITTSTAETDKTNNSASLPLEVLEPDLDLLITKTDGPDPLEIWKDTTYVITVRNRGPSDAFNVTILDEFPTKGLAHPRVAEKIPSDADCSLSGTSETVAGGSLSCDIAHLPAGASAQITVLMRGIERGVHTNTVSVTSDETAGSFEGPEDNNESYENTTVRESVDLLVTKVPSAAVIDLREAFSWTITVTNQVGDGLGYAEAVTLSDMLPEGMVLTEEPVTTRGSCTGVVGAREISCAFGDLDNGESAVVTLTTKITSMSAQSAENSATADTLSFEKNPEDNTGKGSVATVMGSSIAGTIYRDFDKSDSMDAGIDTGIAGVTLTLAGIAFHDDAEISASTTTGVDGTYEFTELPPGTYRVSYATVDEVSLVPGKALPSDNAEGSPAGDGVDAIDGIVITSSVISTGQDFTLHPMPRIEVSKVVDAVTVRSDGSYRLSYSITIENLSLEPVMEITVTDVLGGESKDLGTYVPAQPENGEYTIASSSASWGTLHGSFNGSDKTTLVSNITLGINETTTVGLVVHVNPSLPRAVPPLVHTNQANASGSGEWSNEPVSDSSTVTVAPEPEPEIELEKTASFTPAGAMAVPGEVVSYSFTVTNTGDTPLLNVGISDVLDGIVWVQNTPIARLNPGESNTTAFSATYELTQEDIDRGTLPNTATVVGTWGDDGTPIPVTVEDSDDANVTALSQPGLEIVKTLHESFVGDQRPEPGDLIWYEITVTNTGNTNLHDVGVSDDLVGVQVAPGDSFTIGTLAPGQDKTIRASYAVTLEDINAGEVINIATASGVHGPDDTPITSDPDSVTEPLFQEPGLTLVKVLTSTVPDEPRAGDELEWTVTATNTGNVTLTDLVLTDPFPGASILPLSVASLEPDDWVDFTVTAPITQDDINVGEVTNQARIDFKNPGDPEGPVYSNEPSTPLPQAPAIALKKTGDVIALSTPPQQGDEIAYTIVIKNTGNVPLDTLDLVDLLDGVELDAAQLATLRATVLHPLDTDGVAAGLNEITVTAIYRITTEDIEEGMVINTAVVTGLSTSTPRTPVTDQGGTTFESDDPTRTELVAVPEIFLVKTITNADLSTPPKAGDLITYGFAIHNTGNVTLTDIVLTELVSGVEVHNPTDWSGPLAVGGIETDAITATYALTQDDIDLGSFANQAKVQGIGPGIGGVPQTVTDISGTDITNDDETIQNLPRTASISIVKSESADLSTPPMAGDVITYTFLVTNTGSVTLFDVEVTDPLFDLDMPQTTIPKLLPGEDNAVELTGTYAIKQSDIVAGEVRNIASVTSVDKDPVDGTPLANPGDVSEEIVVPLVQVGAIALVKTADSALGDPALVGQEITYTFVVTNTGNLDLGNVLIEDPLVGLTPDSIVVGDLAPGESQTFTAVYAIDQDDIDREQVSNQATASGDALTGPVTDLSGPTITTDEATIVPVIPPAPSMTIVKTGSFANEGGYTRPGDVIEYQFLVTNTGNVALEDVTPRELELSFGGHRASGAIGPMSPGPLTLGRDGQATFTAQYVLTQDDINLASGIVDGVSNSADATGLYAGEEIIAPQDTVTLSMPAQEPADISLAKRALVGTIRRGDTVSYLITLTNKSLADVGLVSINDRIPAGFVFVEDTATVNAVAVTPSVAGRNVTFDDVRLPPEGTVEIGLMLRALPGTQPGRYRNTVSGIDDQGTPLAPPAHADVLIEAEAVFDCSDVIGTVFNDLNNNGYQDEGEPGIAGARVSTVRGSLITTDAFGRFSVPCADLPNGTIGSNFVLKLDERTLPTGFSPTTDNPAMVRLTAGKMVEMNFGASLGREIRLGIDATAFIAGSVATTPALDGGIDQLMGLLGEHTTILVITYRGDASDPLARQRLDHVTGLIRDRWRQAKEPYRLVINTDIVER